MIGTIVGLLIGVVAGVGFTSHGARPRSAASAETAALPPCPSPQYSVDGNISPLFCKIDNPRAIAFYKPIFPRLFALGRDASPQQIYLALKRDEHHATIPEMCSAYALWQWRWHWRFAINPANEVASVASACGEGS